MGKKGFGLEDSHSRKLGCGSPSQYASIIFSSAGIQLSVCVGMLV